MKNLIILKLLLTFLILTHAAVSYSNECSRDVSLENSWFTPFLTENNHDMCAEILRDAQNNFLSEDSPYFSRPADIASMHSVSMYENNLGVSTEEVTLTHKRTGESYKEKKPFIILNGNKFYLHDHKAISYGVYELYQLLVSKDPAPDNIEELEKVSPPPASSYQLFRASDNSYWLCYLDEDDNLHTYQLQDSGSWVKTCQVNFHPPSLGESDDPVIQKAYEALMKLKTTVFGLTRGAGNCGTLGTHGRLRNHFLNILPSVLYRPWALKEERDRWNDDTYDRDLVGLKDWSLMGISEYNSFHNYLSTLEPVIKDIASFYEAKYGWEPSDAINTAKTAITTVVSSTIGFYIYDPIASESERQLRIAILEKKPLSHIRNIPTTLAPNYYRRNESLLSLAVEYPEALKILLESGLDPNSENDFGKTPLMYAAQYNQYESVKLLLEYGANPNEMTTEPEDTCFYTIYTLRMTPLHYSVRYASAEIIKLILDYGGEPSITAENTLEQPHKKETPLDWLKRYTQKVFLEKNPNIDDSQIDSIEKWLTVGDKETLSKKAKKSIKEAESQYQAGEESKAYQSISLALAIDPDNERALSDMSLIALKNGNLGQSMEAGEKLINQKSSNKIQANAFFNQGLACEKRQKDYGSGTLYYNGNTFCNYGYLDFFYKALKANPTAARKNKILDIFNSSQGGYCELPELNIKIIFQTGQRYRHEPQTLFVLHKSDMSLSGSDFAWSVTSNDKSTKEIVPVKKDSISLGEYTLSLFTSNDYTEFPYDILGYRCTDRKSVAQKIAE